MNEQTVTMTAEQKAQFEAWQAEQARKQEAEARKSNREAYKQLVDEQVARTIPELEALSEGIRAAKSKVWADFSEILRMKEEVMNLTREGQFSHTFTTSDGQMRIRLGVRTIDTYDDTVEDGIAMVHQVIRSFAKDERSQMLVGAVLRLLAKDEAGNLKASRVLQLRKMADEINDERFTEGVTIIEEAYRPMASKQFVTAERKNEQGAWVTIPLGMTEA